MGNGKTAIALGLLAWGVSWFVSPHDGLSAMGEMEKGLKEFGATLGQDEPGGEPSASPKDLLAPGFESAVGPVPRQGPLGWRAFRFAWTLLTTGESWSDIGKDARPAILGLTSLTNAVMLVAAFLLLAGRGGRGLGFLLLACAALDGAWFYLGGREIRSGLAFGYWLWLGSFALAGFGFLARSKDVQVT